MAKIDARIQALTAPTGGAVRTRDLYAAGISRDAIARRITDGSLVRWCGDVVLIAAVADDPPLSTRLHAATLAGHTDSMLAHATAIAHLGCWDRWNGTIHVVSTSVRERPWPDDVVFHRMRRTLPEEARTVVDGIPTMAAPYACAHLGTELDRFQVVHVMRELEFRGLLDPADLPKILGDLHRPRGATVVRAALDLLATGSNGTRSRSEDRLLTGLLRSGAPEPLVNVRGATGLPGVELDFVWPLLRVVVECDGEQHASPSGRRNDADVDARLHAEGWMVIRIPSIWVWNDLAGCVRHILNILWNRVPESSRVHDTVGTRR